MKNNDQSHFSLLLEEILSDCQREIKEAYNDYQNEIAQLQQLYGISQNTH